MVCRLRDYDAVFSDNWFDIHGEEPIRVALPRKSELNALSPKELRSQLEIAHY